MVFTKLLLENALVIRPCNCEAASKPLLPKVAHCIPVLPSRHIGMCAAHVLKRSGFHLQRTPRPRHKKTKRLCACAVILRTESLCFSSKLAKHEVKTMSHHSKHHFITHHISLRCTAVNEFYQMMRMGVAGHVRGNRTKTNE